MTELTGLVPIGTPFTFTSPYDQYAARRNTAARVVGHVVSADDDHDDEVLPMYRIRFESDGTEIEAWPEEVEGA